MFINLGTVPEMSPERLTVTYLQRIVHMLQHHGSLTLFTMLQTECPKPLLILKSWKLLFFKQSHRVYINLILFKKCIDMSVGTITGNVTAS